LAKGHHVLVDCYDVRSSVCKDDQRVQEALVNAAKNCGANVLGTMRYHFGHNSPAGFAIVVMLDESHCSAHAYADEGLIAFDFFTCGDTDPELVWEFVRRELDPDETWMCSIQRRSRFTKVSE